MNFDSVPWKVLTKRKSLLEKRIVAMQKELDKVKASLHLQSLKLANCRKFKILGLVDPLRARREPLIHTRTLREMGLLSLAEARDALFKLNRGVKGGILVERVEPMPTSVLKGAICFFHIEPA